MRCSSIFHSLPYIYSWAKTQTDTQTRTHTELAARVSFTWDHVVASFFQYRKIDKRIKENQNTDNTGPRDWAETARLQSETKIESKKKINFKKRHQISFFPAN